MLAFIRHVVARVGRAVEGIIAREWRTGYAAGLRVAALQAVAEDVVVTGHRRPAHAAYRALTGLRSVADVIIVTYEGLPRLASGVRVVSVADLLAVAFVIILAERGGRRRGLASVLIVARVDPVAGIVVPAHERGAVLATQHRVARLYPVTDVVIVTADGRAGEASQHEIADLRPIADVVVLAIPIGLAALAVVRTGHTLFVQLTNTIRARPGRGREGHARCQNQRDYEQLVPSHRYPPL
jgi:hypothetical protein